MLLYVLRTYNLTTFTYDTFQLEQIIFIFFNNIYLKYTKTKCLNYENILNTSTNIQSYVDPHYLA